MLSITSVLGSVAAFAAYASASPNYGSSRSSWGGYDDSYDILTDIDEISQYWGQISTYRDNDERYFGVDNVGLPDGCSIEQAHSLQRHANRFPTSYFDDGLNDEAFAAKLLNFTKASPNAGFKGPLAFLNTYKYIMGSSLLTGLGASTEFQAGVQFWNRYGRTLYNATQGQLAYNASFANGTARPKPVLRTTGQSRIYNSEINWALGFFGPSFQKTPDPKLSSFTSGQLFDVVVIPEGGTENNTLASYDSCFADDLPFIGDIGDRDLINQWVPLYLKDATARLQKYAPSGFTFTVNDTFAMQSICAYETGYISSSDFCNLFTQEEWEGHAQAWNIGYWYDYAFGNPTGRAQGLGYLQELKARLTKQYITSSNSSVNSTLDNNAAQFPLGQPFYVDFTHDDIIVSLLTAMSVDYFKEAPKYKQYPVDTDEAFQLSQITPFGGRLITEVIGCTSANPAEVKDHRTLYYPGQYGYVASAAKNKFIRIRINNAVVPLDTIRGGKCAGRKDGLCSLENFLASQQNAEKLANYDFSCFANYTLKNPGQPIDYDGAVNNKSSTINIYPGRLTADYINSL